MNSHEILELLPVGLEEAVQNVQLADHNGLLISNPLSDDISVLLQAAQTILNPEETMRNVFGEKTKKCDREFLKKILIVLSETADFEHPNYEEHCEIADELERLINNVE